jgi:hypothetical protein
MLTDLIPPSKDTVWQTGLKRKIQQSIAHSRPIIDKNKHWLRMKVSRKVYQASGPQNR